MSRSTAQLPHGGHVQVVEQNQLRAGEEEGSMLDGPNPIDEVESKRLIQENWGSLLEFLGDEGANDYRNSVASTTHGTSAMVQPRGSHKSDATVGITTATPGSMDQSKEYEANTAHATVRPLEDAKLQSLVDFSKKVGLNHRVIQTVHLIEQSG